MAKLIANTKGVPEQDWLELRRGGIGGSDASAVAKANKYSSPVMVYMDKLGLYVGEKPERVKMAAEFGHKLEPIVRATFVEKVNAERMEQGKKPIRVVHRQAIFAHDEHDWMRTNLDGIVYDPELGQGVFEAKTAHYMLREEWAGEDVPNQYYIQCQHNMAVMGMDYAWLAVLIGGNDYRHYFIKRDQEFIDYLIMIEKAFWENHILQRIPPAMSGHDAEKEMLAAQYPQSEPREGYITTLPTACIEMAEQVDAIKGIVDQLKQEQTALENEIKAIMGETEQAFAGSHKITWKTASNGVRSLRIKLDSQKDRDKFYADKLKPIEKELKEIAKERKNIEKEAEKARKLAEKERKIAEKAAKDALKAEKVAAKEAKLPVGDVPEFVVTTKRQLERLEKDKELLLCLQAAGVDNWQGYDDAMEMLRNEKAEVNE
jgi:putative phage-type endonuclease